MKKNQHTELQQTRKKLLRFQNDSVKIQVRRETSGNDALTLASSKSTRVSLAGVRIGRYDLNERRLSLLSRVPNPGSYSMVEKDSLELMDLAFLSAKTGDEFAILRSKQNDVLFHGTSNTCRFTGELENGLKNHRYELIGHSHPGEDDPEPSIADRQFLMMIGQKRSTVISARTGIEIGFTDNPFE